MYTIEVSHTTDTGHRVVGHQAADGSPGKCSRIHGHTYRFDVEIAAPKLTGPGFVVDFAIVKATLNEWDHRLLLWDQDDYLIRQADPGEFHANGSPVTTDAEAEAGVVRLPFNPTAENMARHLAERYALLDGVERATVIVSETQTSHATWEAWKPQTGTSSTH